MAEQGDVGIPNLNVPDKTRIYYFDPDTHQPLSPAESARRHDEFAFREAIKPLGEANDRMNEQMIQKIGIEQTSGMEGLALQAKDGLKIMMVKMVTEYGVPMETMTDLMEKWSNEVFLKSGGSQNSEPKLVAEGIIDMVQKIHGRTDMISGGTRSIREAVKSSVKRELTPPRRDLFFRKDGSIVPADESKRAYDIEKRLENGEGKELLKEATSANAESNKRVNAMLVSKYGVEQATRMEKIAIQAGMGLKSMSIRMAEEYGVSMEDIYPVVAAWSNAVYTKGGIAMNDSPKLVAEGVVDMLQKMQRRTDTFTAADTIRNATRK